MQGLQEFSADGVYRHLKEAYCTGNLDAALKTHWSHYVPIVFSTQQNADVSKEDKKSRKFLFTPMERFLCDGDPETVFLQLKEKDNPSQLCGRVFKMGEPTYFCRDCGTDPTCVLCIGCFQHSVHKKHRYKMSTSGGGGYCDCGDKEAWKCDPYCDQHRKNSQENEEQGNAIENLPQDLRDKAKQLFTFSIQYATDLCTWPHCDTLPPGLEQTKEPSYITMLFNDEVHTYEQVISTLTKAIECTHKEAVEFATTVDREGRTTVKCSNFKDCETARNTIERNTSRHGSKPLKVQVMHTSIVAHQNFALKIMPWLQKIIAHSGGLRQLFCQLIMQKPSALEHSFVEKMLLADTKLWKGARIQSHQLFMAGVLMDPECKKQFAIVFAQMYPALMRLFIDDDHDHSVCAVSDTVQIFTVPTLARTLITDHNVLQIILDTFLKECEAKKTPNGKFLFDKTDRSQLAHQAFKRAQYMLYDLKYILTIKPSPQEWNDKLRINFMNGYRSLQKLLQCMQGMDAVTRQQGQHIEFEPEWEGAFNLQLKLEDNIAETLDWCSSDYDVMKAAFLSAIDVLCECNTLETIKTEDCKVGEHVTDCIKYDVSSQPVSIHLPVTRMLAGLYPKMSALGFNLRELHLDTKLKPRELMEPSLRTCVMIAQTQAGMWRRNGYSLLNQIYFYHNVRCRTEMMDKDVVMLQAGAALIPPNDYIVHLMNKFNLLNWIKEDYDTPGVYEDSVRQTVALAEEFLLLLIHVISERYLPGIGEVDHKEMVKREIIHQLCINPMAHSELTRALPEDPNHETGVEETVHEVATFKKPASGTGKGLFELKAECYKMYNPFFYHYTRTEQSKSEEAQRKRKKQANEDQALPPPVPPLFVENFKPIRHLLDCDTMIHVITIILRRTGATRSRSWTEAQFEKILHLIGLALHEEELARVTNDVQFRFLEKAAIGKNNIFRLLEGLVGNSNITHQTQKDLLAWILKKFTEVRQMRDRSSAHAMDTTSSIFEGARDDKLERERKKKAELAEKRRAKIMAKMSKMQKEFIKENAELFEGTNPELQPAESEMELGNDEHLTVAIGAKKSPAAPVGVMRDTCILCQEEQEITQSGRAMVLAAFVQESTVLSKARGKLMDEPSNYKPLFLPAELTFGAHTSTCGHVMHSDCWQRFYDSIVAKERRRRRNHTSFDVARMEFLCPLCETLSNTVIPIIPPLASLLKGGAKQEVSLNFNDWLDGIQKTVKNSIQEAADTEDDEEAFLYVPCPLSSVTKMMADSVAKNWQLLFDYVYDDESGHFSDSITDMLKKFSTDIFAIGLGLYPDDDDVRVPIMGWSTCAFTILTIEQSLRDEGKPLFGSLPSRQADCLSALVKFSAVCSQVIQMKVVKKHCINLLSALTSDASDKKLETLPNILEMDMFHYLVTLTLSLPSLYAEEENEGALKTALTRIPTGGLNEQHALQLTLTAHFTQIMLTADFDEQVECMDLGEGDSEGGQMLKIYKTLRCFAGIETTNYPSEWQILSYVRTACLPYLRCCALFFHYLTGVRQPAALTEKRSPTEEFHALCEYLSLSPSIPKLFSNHEENQIISKLVKNWCSDEGVANRISKASSEKIVHYPHSVNQLIQLPQDYSELINSVSTFTCPKSDGDDSRAPTMCLICGKMLCSQSYCCQTELDKVTVGAATAHAHQCGSGTGMFLRVRECQVLLLCGRTKGCFFPPPYLDDYGETDQGLRRGNPLHLCPERYRRLQKLWLNHGIPEEIAHCLESNSGLMNIDWNHL